METDTNSKKRRQPEQNEDTQGDDYDAEEDERTTKKLKQALETIRTRCIMRFTGEDGETYFMACTQDTPGDVREWEIAISHIAGYVGHCLIPLCGDEEEEEEKEEEESAPAAV